LLAEQPKLVNAAWEEMVGIPRQEVIGKPLDDQLRIEGWNSYTCVDQAEARELLRQFFDKTDAGRAGGHPTEA